RQTAIGDAVGPYIAAAGVEIAAGQRERKAGAQRNNSVRLPAAQQSTGDPLVAPGERKLVNKIDDHVVCLVELIARLGSPAVQRVLEARAFVTARLALGGRLAECIRKADHQATRIAFLGADLKPIVRAAAVAVEVPDIAQVLKASFIIDKLIGPPLLKVRIGRRPG